MDKRYKSLGDGRKECPECMDSAVMTTKNCQPLYRDILKFYRVNLGMPIEQEVPMLLVEREALNNAREVEKDVSHLLLFSIFTPYFRIPTEFYLWWSRPKTFFRPQRMISFFLSFKHSMVSLYLINHVVWIQGHTHAPETRGLCLSEEQILPVSWFYWILNASFLDGIPPFVSKCFRISVHLITCTSSTSQSLTETTHVCDVPDLHI